MVNPCLVLIRGSSCLREIHLLPELLQCIQYRSHLISSQVQVWGEFIPSVLPKGDVGPARTQPRQSPPMIRFITARGSRIFRLVPPHIIFLLCHSFASRKVTIGRIRRIETVKNSQSLLWMDVWVVLLLCISVRDDSRQRIQCVQGYKSHSSRESTFCQKRV